MANFLTEKAIFTCGSSPLKRFSVRANQGKLKLNGSPVLTRNSTLYSPTPVQCELVASSTNGLQQFCPKLFQPWQDGMHGAHTTGGVPLLTTDSYCLCLQFNIKISFFGFDYKNPNLFCNARALGGSSTASFSKDGNAAKVPTGSGTTGQAGINDSGKMTYSARQDAPCENAVAMPKEASLQTAATAKAAKNDDEKLFYACGKCSRTYCHIDKALLEKYRKKKFSEIKWLSTPLTVNNKSQVLKKNYLDYYQGKGFDKLFCPSSGAITDDYDENAATLADRAYGEAEQKLREAPGQWKYQAHHLISGKQVFAKLLDLVRMASVCDYDINHHRNCIMLISNEDDFGVLAHGMKHFGDGSAKVDEAKATQAYVAMKKAKMQWHVSHHFYSFDEEEIREIRNAINHRSNSPGKFCQEGVSQKGNCVPDLDCYKKLLEDTLQSVVRGLVGETGGDKHKPVCPMDFIDSMNNISATIRDKLAAFYNNFQDSFPWYVSRASYLLAFGLPEKFRLITVRVKERSFLLEKFKLTSGLDGEENVKMDGSPLLYDPENDPPGKCVRFCSNIEHFLFFGNCEAAVLPFNFDRDKPETDYCRKALHGNYGSLGYLEANLTEMLAWVGGTMNYEPLTSAQRIKQRMQKLKIGNRAQQ